MEIGYTYASVGCACVCGVEGIAATNKVNAAMRSLFSFVLKSCSQIRDITYLIFIILYLNIYKIKSFTFRIIFPSLSWAAVRQQSSHDTRECSIRIAVIQFNNEFIIKYSSYMFARCFSTRHTNKSSPCLLIFLNSIFHFIARNVHRMFIESPEVTHTHLQHTTNELVNASHWKAGDKNAKSMSIQIVQ